MSADGLWMTNRIKDIEQRTVRPRCERRKAPRKNGTRFYCRRTLVFKQLALKNQGISLSATPKESTFGCTFRADRN
jgi:hypothetical protein